MDRAFDDKPMGYPTGGLTLHSRVARIFAGNDYRDIVIHEMLESDIQWFRWTRVIGMILGVVIGFVAGAALVFSQWAATLPQ